MVKKIIWGVLALAIVVGLTSTVFAADLKEKTTTKVTKKGVVTKERAELKTGLDTEKVKTVAITNGQFTTEKGKVIKTNKAGDVKVEKVKFKLWNDNDPANNSDNTVIMYKGRDEVVRHVCDNIKENHFKAIKDKGTIYSTYNPLKEGWEVSYVE